MTVLEEKPDDPCHAPILASNITNLRGYDEVAAGQPEATVRGAACGDVTLLAGSSQARPSAGPVAP